MLDSVWSFVGVAILYVLQPHLADVIDCLIGWLLSLFGFRVYVVLDAVKYKTFLSRTKARSFIFVENSMRGLVYGWPYIGFVGDPGNSKYISERCVREIFWIVCNQATWQQLQAIDLPEFNSTVNGASVARKPKYSIVQVYTSGDHGGILSYKIPMVKTPTAGQLDIIDEIVRLYNARGSHSVTCAVYGQPGVGKTTIGQLLAARLNASLFPHYNPFNLGVGINYIYVNSVKCDNEGAPSPLVIVLNDFAHHLTRLSQRTPGMIACAPSDRMPDVVDKASWNSLLDRVDSGLFPYVILLLTTDVPFSVIDEADPAYLRENRVHARFTLKSHQD